MGFGSHTGAPEKSKVIRLELAGIRHVARLLHFDTLSFNKA